MTYEVISIILKGGVRPSYRFPSLRGVGGYASSMLKAAVVMEEFFTTSSRGGIRGHTR